MKNERDNYKILPISPLRLDARGFSHDFLLVFFVIIFSICGAAYLVASHADPITTPSGSWASLGSSHNTQHSQTVAAYACKFSTSSTVWEVHGFFELSNSPASQNWHGHIINRGTHPYPGYASRENAFSANSRGQQVVSYVYNNQNNFLDFGYDYSGAPAALHTSIASNIRAGNLPTCTNLHPSVNIAKPAATIPVAPSVPKPVAAKSYFYTRGNRIYDTNRKSFIPYGISVATDISKGTTGANNWQLYTSQTDAQIRASANYWHSNTIRIPVSEDVLLRNPTAGYGFNLPAMQRLVAEVDEIENLGNAPWITDSPLFTSGSGSAAPGQSTSAFWQYVPQYLASKGDGRYGNIIYDLYNESKSDGATWQSQMQSLVNEVRGGNNALRDNLIVVEAPNKASTLTNLDQYPIAGKNVAFASHFKGLYNHTVDYWRGSLGLNLKKKVPVIQGEWSQFAANRSWECDPNAASDVPKFLTLLRANHVGLIFYTLGPGIGVYTSTPTVPQDTVTATYPTTDPSYSIPNTIKSNYGCPVPGQPAGQSKVGAALGQGAGSYVMRYFKTYSQNP